MSILCIHVHHGMMNNVSGKSFPFRRTKKPFHELILQIGDKENMSVESENGQLARQVLDEMGIRDRRNTGCIHRS